MSELLMLDWMKDHSIFCVSKEADGLFHFTEACDNYFTLPLSKAQVLQLADELKQLAEQ